jgi:hypothetical protein
MRGFGTWGGRRRRYDERRGLSGSGWPRWLLRRLSPCRRLSGLASPSENRRADEWNQKRSGNHTSRRFEPDRARSVIYVHVGFPDEHAGEGGESGGLAPTYGNSAKSVSARSASTAEMGPYFAGPCQPDLPFWIQHQSGVVGGPTRPCATASPGAHRPRSYTTSLGDAARLLPFLTTDSMSGTDYEAESETNRGAPRARTHIELLPRIFRRRPRPGELGRLPAGAGRASERQIPAVACTSPVGPRAIHVETGRV